MYKPFYWVNNWQIIKTLKIIPPKIYSMPPFIFNSNIVFPGLLNICTFKSGYFITTPENKYGVI